MLRGEQVKRRQIHLYLLCHSLNWQDRESTKWLHLNKTNKNMVNLIELSSTTRVGNRNKNTWFVAIGNIFGNIPGIAGLAPVIWPASATNIAFQERKNKPQPFILQFNYIIIRKMLTSAHPKALVKELNMANKSWNLCILLFKNTCSNVNFTSFGFLN
jgi:hypothetical protein